MTEEEFLEKLKAIKGEGWTINGSGLIRCNGLCPIEKVAVNDGFQPPYSLFYRCGARFLGINNNFINSIVGAADSCDSIFRPMRQKLLNALDLKEVSRATN